MMDSNNQIPIDYHQTIDNNSPSHFNDGLDFLTELFDRPAENELNQNSDYQEVIDDLFNSALTPNSDNVQKTENSGKEHSLLLAELSKENEKLKCAIKRLKKKIIARQSKMANYEIRLARSMTDLIAANKELEELRKEKIFYEAENQRLSCLVEQHKYEIKQYESVKLTNDEANLKIKELEREISRKMSIIRKLKKNSADYRSRLAKKDTELKSKHHHIEQLLFLLSECGNKLENAGLLTKDFSMDLMKKYSSLLLKTSKTRGSKNSFSEMISAFFNNPLKLADEGNSNNFNFCIEDQTVTSFLPSPISSVASNNEVEASNDSMSLDAFRTEHHDLPKRNKPKSKLSENSKDKADQNWDLCNSPESINFVEVFSNDMEGDQLSIPPSLPVSDTNHTKNAFTLNDNSISTCISQPLSKFNDQVFTGSQSTRVTSNSDLVDPIPLLGNFHSSNEIHMFEGCQLENTFFCEQGFQSVEPLQDMISSEKYKSTNTFQSELHKMSKEKNKYKNETSYKNSPEEDQDWNLCSPPDLSISDKEVHSCNKEKEEMIILSPSHDSFVNDSKKLWKSKEHSISNNITQPLSKINKKVFTSSQSVEVISCSATNLIDMTPTLSMPILLKSDICVETNTSVPTFKESWLQNNSEICDGTNTSAPTFKESQLQNNSEICDEVNMSLPTLEENELQNNSDICSETKIYVPNIEKRQLQNNLLSKQDSCCTQPLQEIFSTEFKSMNICASRESNQKIFDRDLLSTKHSADSIMSINSQADSNGQSEFLEVEDMESVSCAESM